METIDVPVLIVGGGGAGLTCSMLLSNLGIDALLVSAAPTTSVLPKAHVLNQRAMEIMTDVGTAEEIYRRGTPPEQMRYSAYYAGFAGPDSIYGKQIARIECWGGGGLDLGWAEASPCHTSNLPQIRLEPILKARAEELAPNRIRFHHEVTEVEQDGDGVTATVRDKSDDTVYRVRSKYLLACDGGRTIGRSLGIEMQGPRDVMRIVSIYMSADLSKWARDPDVLIRWIWITHRGMLVTLVPMGPSHWGPESEEWVLHINYDTFDTRAIDDAQVIADMNDALGVPNLDAKIHVISRWSMEGILADRFQAGRVFLVGDAAHRHPPTGGLGLTSAMHDAQNLCWKIAAVLSGKAGAGLLETYEAERRPADARNIERSLENSVNHAAIGHQMGFSAAASPDENLAGLRRALSQAPEDRSFRRAALAAAATQSMEFREHVVEFGQRFQSKAIVTGDEAPPPALDDIRLYEPSTFPGSPLPHAELEDLDGNRLPLMKLVRPGEFLLIAGEDGQPWCEAAAAISAANGLVLRAVRIGHLDGDYRDPRCAWLRYRGIGSQGAVLVRPDRYVAWRSHGASIAPGDALRSALSQILCRGLS